jgi:hypothetical protein
MSTKINSLLAVVVLFAVVSFPSISGATPVLKLTSGVNEIIVADGSAHDSNSAEGMITCIGPIGSWTFNETTGTTTFGSISEPVFDLCSYNQSNSAGVAPDNLVMMLSDTGFIGIGQPKYFDATIGGTTLGALSYRTYYGEGLFDLSNEIASLTFTTNPFSGAGSFTGIPEQNFSMTQVVTISHPAGNGISTSFNGMLSDPTPTPEPSSMILLGSGLLGTALFFRRKNLA